MKKYIKHFHFIIAAIVAASLFVSYIPVGAVQTADSALSFEAEGLLRALNIITEEEVQHDKSITRAQMAGIVFRVINAEKSEGSNIFYDVEAGDAYFKEISALVEMGIILGDGEGFFRPDDIVTDAEASKMFCAVVGYKEYGHFNSYFNTARSIGLFKGVKADNVMTIGEALRMAYNALHCEMYEPTTYGDTIEYSVRRGYTAIERYFGYIRRTGVVEGAYGSTLTHPSETIKKDELVIGNTVFHYDGGENLLGQSVVYYTEKDTHRSPAQAEIFYICADSDKNNIITIEAEDIIGLSGSDFEYYEENRKRQANMADAFDVIYNGVAYPTYNSADLAPGEGNVRLIDNDDDNIFDVMIVTAYSYVIVEATDETNQVIYGRYPKVVIGDNRNKNLDFKLSRKGMQAHLNVLNDGAVIAVEESKNTDGLVKLNAELLGDERKGSVERLSNDKICVNGESFDISGAMVADEAVRVGDIVTIYLHNGKCAAVKHSETGGYQNGYLVEVKKNDKRLASSLSFKLIDESRNMQTYSIEKRIWIDEACCTDMDAVLSMLRNTAAMTYENDKTKWPYSQPIRYMLNDEGKLTRIDTMAYNQSLETQMSLKQDMEAKYLKYSFYNQTFIDPITEELCFSLENTTDALIVPNLDRDESKWYMSALGDNSEYWVEAYNIDENSMVAKRAIIYESTPSAVYDSAEPWIVTAVETALNEDNAAVKQVELIGQGGATQLKQLSENLTDADISVGDVIRYTQNKDKIIEIFVKVYSADANGPVGARLQQLGANNGYKFSSRTLLSYGTVLSVSDGMITHTTSVSDDIGGVENKENLNNYYVRSDTRVYIYDTSERTPKIREGSVSDIVSYVMDSDKPDRALMNTRTGALLIVYIIK